MVLGISSFAYGWGISAGKHPAQSVDEIDLVGQTISFGLDCLQIGDNFPLHTLTDERLQGLKYLADKHQLRLEVGARKLTPGHLERYLDIAAFLRSPLLRFVIDEAGYEPSSREVIALLKEFLPAFRQRKVMVGIENHDRFKARELADLMEKIGDDHVGICLDCVNSLGAGEGLEWVAGILAPYTINLHIKDFTVNRLPHQMGFTVQGAPAGKGLLNLPWLLKTLAPFRRCQSAVLEQWVIPELNPITTLLKERTWAEESIRYLKPFFNSQSSSN